MKNLFACMRRRCHRLFSALVVIATVAQSAEAQEVFSTGPARFITRFGFEQLTGGVIIIKAAIDDHPDSLSFILDTGSGGISLDSATTTRLKIATEPSNRTIKGIAGMKKVDFAYNHSLRLPGLSVDSLHFHINDYELLTGVYGLKIDGIIGFSFLRRYLVAINYDKKEIEVYYPGEFRYPRGGYILRPAIAGLPMQYATVGDSRSLIARFFLDTGAGLNLLLSNEFQKDSALFKNSKRMYATVAEGLGGKKEMNIAVMKSFKIGPYRFRNIPVYLFEDEYNVTSYPYLCGLIGNDLLRRFNVVLNYPRSEIHLLPNTHYRDEFDYTYSGLGLYAEENHIVVSDVIPQSPADLAGLKIGDILVAVDNNIGNNMQAYKAALQESTRKIKLVVARDNELLQLSMTTIRIKR